MFPETRYLLMLGKHKFNVEGKIATDFKQTSYKPTFTDIELFNSIDNIITLIGNKYPIVQLVQTHMSYLRITKDKCDQSIEFINDSVVITFMCKDYSISMACKSTLIKEDIEIYIEQLS